MFWRGQDKAAALPPEPGAEEEATTSCLIRLPNGTRLSRRFHISDPVRLLFDFVDAKVGMSQQQLPESPVIEADLPCVYTTYCWAMGILRHTGCVIIKLNVEKPPYSP